MDPGIATILQLSPGEAQALWREGSQALRSGGAEAASRAFRRILDGGRGDPTVWFGLALALQRTGDLGAMLDALDRVLEGEPRNIRALMLKADHYDGLGASVAAAAFYLAVVRLGATEPGLAPDLLAEVRRAETAVAAHSARFESHLRRTLELSGLGREGTRRVADSLDMMLGKKAIFLQKPTQYYFPELPQIAVYERAGMPWLDAVEGATDDIRAELLEILREEGAFTPYVEGTRDRPFFDRDGLLDNPDWSAFYLVKNGKRVDANAARCPRTMAALAGAPLCDIPDRTPSILFSLLRPGARIPPHHGLLNTRLICHLALIVPEGCGFRVGAETRQWREGHAWAFDDSIEHEAWNDSDRLRVVLIFDVWRPELTPVERDLVSVILQASPSFEEVGG